MTVELAPRGGFVARLTRRGAPEPDAPAPTAGRRAVAARRAGAAGAATYRPSTTRALIVSYSASVIRPSSSISFALRSRSVGIAARGDEVGRGAGERAADVHAARLGTQLVEVAHAALLAPRLLLRLAERVDLLRLLLAQPLDAHGAAGVAARREIVARERRDGERGAEDAGADVRVVEVLPADVVAARSRRRSRARAR